MHKTFRVLSGTLATISLFALRTGVAQAAEPAAQQIIHNDAQKTIKGSDKFFTGDVLVTINFPGAAGSDLTAGTVTFAPGARSAWHVHPAGQLLMVTSGTGWTQEWGRPVQVVHAGDVIWCPPGVKHWHGATPDSSMTHMAITPVKEGKNVVWMEKVSEAQYHL